MNEWGIIEEEEGEWGITEGEEGEEGECTRREKGEENERVCSLSTFRVHACSCDCIRNYIQLLRTILNLHKTIIPKPKLIHCSLISR